MSDIDPEEDRLRELDSEFGPVKPRAFMRHLNSVGDNLCAECAGKTNDCAGSLPDELRGCGTI